MEISRIQLFHKGERMKSKCSCIVDGNEHVCTAQGDVLPTRCCYGYTWTCWQEDQTLNELFNREDCESDVNLVVVNRNGRVAFGTFSDAIFHEEGKFSGAWTGIGEGRWIVTDVKLDGYNWTHSKTFREIKEIPSWCKIGS